MQTYIYPTSDQQLSNWSGYPTNTVGNLYQNIREGTVSFNDANYITASNPVDIINTSYTVSGTLGFGNCTVIPSSNMILNVRAAASGLVAGLTGSVYLSKAILKNSNSDILGQYDGNGTSWGVGALSGPTYTNGSVNLSGSPWKYNSAYLNDTSMYIQFSGQGIVGGSPGNIGFNVSSMDLFVSGTTGVSYSGIPLFIRGPGPVTECLKVIDASGFPIVSIENSGIWINQDGTYIENNTDWWRAVGSGTHTPNDLTYILPYANTFLHPSGIGSLRANSPSWTNENGSSLTISSINSGVSSPVDISYFKTGAVAGIPGLQESPELLFRGPTNLTSVGVQFRAQRYITDDTFTIKNVKLKNSAGTVLHSYSDELTVNGELQNLSVTAQASTSVEWSTENNILIFDVYASPASFMTPSGELRITEIDIVTGQQSVNSPNFYFHAPTMNNILGGSTACFRMSSNAGEEIPVTLSNITWKNASNTTLANFSNITVSPPISSYQNYCTPSSLVSYSDSSDRNYLSFTTSVPSGYQLGNVRFSEIEVCNTGIDPISSSYIPLYTYGVGTSNSGLDLYIQGYATQSSGLDLFINGPFTYSSGIPLYTAGLDVKSSGVPLIITGFSTSSSGIPLYVDGVGFSSSGIPLYTQGPILSNSYMPLFLKADTIPSIFGSIPLSIQSTTNSGLFKSLPMFIQGTGDLNTYMPLFLKGQESDSTSSNMPLFLKTIGNLDGSMTVESGLPLFLGNYWSSQSSGIPLYVQVQSGTLGAIPTSASMSLFIARDSEATANFLPLTIKVADTQNSGIPLYTFGAFLYNSGIPLVIPSTKDTNTNHMPLFSHGF